MRSIFRTFSKSAMTGVKPLFLISWSLKEIQLVAAKALSANIPNILLTLMTYLPSTGMGSGACTSKTEFTMKLIAVLKTASEGHTFLHFLWFRQEFLMARESVLPDIKTPILNRWSLHNQLITTSAPLSTQNATLKAT